MLTLANEYLTVELLHPNHPHPAHGNRYCRGGYIWQIYSGDGEPLVSGPEYPHPSPSPFNGQGFPEVIRHEHKQTGRLLTRDENGDGLVIGIGRTSGPGRSVTEVFIAEPADWEIQSQAQTCVMQTAQSAAGFGYELQREVGLEGRTLLSRSSLRNTGKRTIPLIWYAHPFFSHDARGLTSCRFAAPIQLDVNPGFSVDGHLLTMQPDHDWVKGCFQWIHGITGQTLSARISHRQLAGIDMLGDFPMLSMPVWANRNTLSIEPYLEQAVEPGESYTWSLRYTFLPALS